MAERAKHDYAPATSFDGGELDCGNGLLLLIRKHIDPLARGQLLEIVSLEPTVEEELPAWCRLTGNELISLVKQGRRMSFLVSKGPFVPAATVHEVKPGSGTAETDAGPGSSKRQAPIVQPIVEVEIPLSLPEPGPAPVIAPLSVMGMGSWPRPRWMLRALHEHLEGRMSRAEFEATADDAVRLAAEAQRRAGVDVLTDGEQRRDNYSSFVGGLLDNCQLIPITDLLPYVDDPDEFERELRSLDVPAGEIRHPAVFGRLGRSQALALHEFEFMRSLGDEPVKIALPGPYLLTRTMWMECISDRAY